ncbi:MAG TPA: TIGR01459 family HAD-type hydrolase [Acidiphilium sp.]
MRMIPGLAALEDVADGFLVDQFGTIHDGENPCPGAVDALRRLRAAGKKVILLSNSGRRGWLNEERLDAMGIGKECYEASLSSGEVAWAALSADPPAVLRRHCRVLLFARGRSLDILDGFDVELVEDARDADLVMLAGSETDRHGYDALWVRLEPAARRGIPAICTNPDRVMMVGGALYPGAGALADAYRAAGGTVLWFGKPHPQIYAAAFRRLPGISRRRIVGVGDSIEHDIAGAAAQGCRTLLVRTGILAGADTAGLDSEMARFGARPDAIVPEFVW